jgi:hypothetical protein
LAPHSAAQRGAVLAAIERYLAAHPDAADNAEGIAQWWLPTCGVNALVPQVEAALEQGLKEGRLRRLQVPGGGVIWGTPRP